MPCRRKGLGASGTSQRSALAGGGAAADPEPARRRVQFASGGSRERCGCRFGRVQEFRRSSKRAPVGNQRVWRQACHVLKCQRHRDLRRRHCSGHRREAREDEGRGRHDGSSRRPCRRVVAAVRRRTSSFRWRSLDSATAGRAGWSPTKSSRTSSPLSTRRSSIGRNGPASVSSRARRRTRPPTPTTSRSKSGWVLLRGRDAGRQPVDLDRPRVRARSGDS